MGNNAVAYLEKAKEAKLNGNLDGAIDYCHEVIKCDANVFWAYHLIGSIYEQQEKFDRAIEFYEQSIDLDRSNPKNFASYYRMGLVFAKQNLLEEAIAVQERALQINPSFADSYHEIAGVFAKQGNLDLAIQFQRQAKELKSNDPNINFAAINFEERQKNLVELGKYNYKLISLGFDCLPRTIATRWGIKPSRLQGEKSCPFDLAFHSYSNIYHLLKNDFQDYLDPQYLQTIPYDLYPNKSIVFNTKYFCKFNHEYGESWQKNNFLNFRERYRQRIENFYDYLHSNPILFILNLPYDRPAFIPTELVDIIARKFPDLYFKILVINTNLNDGENHLQSEDSRILSEYIPLPSSAYQWSMSKYYTSEAGIEFEREIASCMKKAIIKYF
jgi:tetratricopeptide (TPR) repeat protein